MIEVWYRTIQQQILTIDIIVSLSVLGPISSLISQRLPLIRTRSLHRSRRAYPRPYLLTDGSLKRSKSALLGRTASRCIKLRQSRRPQQ